MKKISKKTFVKNLISIVLCFIVVFGAMPVNNIYAATKVPNNISPEDTNFLLLSTLVYDDSLKTPKDKKPKKININDYPTFKKRCDKLIKDGKIPYKSLDILSKKHLNYYEIVKVSKNPKSGFFGAIFRQNYKGKYYYTVVFRGTDIKNKKISSLSPKDVEEDIAAVAIGVYSNQSNDACQLVREAIKEKPHTLTIVGHSLGGFLAQICYTKILTNEIKLPKVFPCRLLTFNSPGFISKLGGGAMNTSPAKSITNLALKLPGVKISGNKLLPSSSSYGLVRHYLIKGDPISSIGTQHLYGQEIVFNVSTSNKLSFDNHSIEQFYKFGTWRNYCDIYGK